MKESVFILILATIWFSSCGQSTNDQKPIESVGEDSTLIDSKQLALMYDLKKYLYKDTTYKSSTSEGITIQNSFPKGGSIEQGGVQYFDSTGKSYAFAIFWTRIINESTSGFELKINFPADSFAVFSSPDSYLKLFLPTDIMTYEKLPLYNYGVTGLKTFLDSNFNKATELQKTINPNEEFLFYVAALSHKAAGTVRAEMVLKEKDLYYKISIAPHGSALIPCGKIAF